MDYIHELKEVAEAAKIILDVASQTHKRPAVMCPHKIWPQYPTHAWWCDECFGRLQFALEILEFTEKRLRHMEEADTEGCLCAEKDIFVGAFGLLLCRHCNKPAERA